MLCACNSARKTLFTPSHAPVDLALLAPCRETRKCHLIGSILTLRDAWLGSAKGTDSEEWTGNTMFTVEGCARVPAHSLYSHGMTCTSSVYQDLSRVSSACQAEENVVCNFDCSVAYSFDCCHLDSRSAVSGQNLIFSHPSVQRLFR